MKKEITRVKEEITREIRNHFKLKIKAYQKLYDAAKIALKGKFIVLNGLCYKRTGV